MNDRNIAGCFKFVTLVLVVVEVITECCIDPYLPDAAFLDKFQVCRVFEDKFGAPERVVEPCAAESLQVHAKAQLFGGDFFQHGVRF